MVLLLSDAPGRRRRLGLGFGLEAGLALPVRHPGAGPGQDLDLEHRGHEGLHPVFVERDGRAGVGADGGDAGAEARVLDPLAVLEHHEPILSLTGPAGAALAGAAAGLIAAAARREATGVCAVR